MRKILLFLFAFLLAAANARAETETQIMNHLVGLGVESRGAAYIASLVTGGNVAADNNVYELARNAANSADINVWKINATDDLVINSSAGDPIILQLEDDAQRTIQFSAASDVAIKATFGDGGTTAVQQLTVSAATADADDDSTLFLAGGGAVAADGSRGAYISLPGEEVSGGSDIDYVAGAGDTHRWFTGSTATATLGATGLFTAAAGLVATTGGVTASAGNIVNTAGIFNVASNVEAVAGAGTTVADAAALSASKSFHQITGANGTVGWKFPSAAAGDVHFLLSTTAGVPKVYAVSGGTCNGGATDAACTLVTGIVGHICYATAANAWICS